MTLNSIMAIILCYFSEFGRFEASYIKVVEIRPMLTATVTQYS